MKTLKTLALAVVLCIGQITIAQEMNFNEVVTQNPTAEEDLKVVADYLDALVNNNLDKAKGLLADDFSGSGPSDGDTETKEEVIENWTQIHKLRTNQNNDYVVNTWRVLSGEYEGDWVSIWGTYSYTENDTDIKLPYHLTAKVEDGKIQNSIIYYNSLAVAKKMGYELISTELKVENGKLTGKFSSPNCNGYEKVKRIRFYHYFYG